jgi:hypothetical protein
MATRKFKIKPAPMPSPPKRKGPKPAPMPSPSKRKGPKPAPMPKRKLEQYITIPKKIKKFKKGGLMEPYSGSYISGTVDGKKLSNPSYKKYYGSLLKGLK